MQAKAASLHVDYTYVVSVTSNVSANDLITDLFVYYNHMYAYRSVHNGKQYWVHSQVIGLIV